MTIGASTTPASPRSSGFGPSSRNQTAANLGGLSTQSTTQPSPQRTDSPAISVTSQVSNELSPSVSTAPRVASSEPTIHVFTIVVPPPLPPARYTSDTLTLSENRVVNGSYQPVDQSGISSYRPEIVSLLNYVPAYDREGKLFTTAGQWIDINFQARVLRENTLSNLVVALSQATSSVGPSQPSVAQSTRDLATSYNNKLTAIKANIDYQNFNYRMIRALEDNLDIKTITDNSFDTSSGFRTLKEFFVSKQQFPRESFEIFSETKILGQLMFDLRSIVENYSLSLLDSVDADRVVDTDPVTYDKTYAASRFTTAGLVSVNNARNAALPKEFTNFANALPNNADDKIKLLTTVLSKELRVSRGLSKPVVQQKLLNFFRGNSVGNPFDNIVGNIGNNIFEQPAGDNSLCSLLYMKSNNNLVLPFEAKYIDDNQTTYLPGSKFFVDTILSPTSTGQFNLAPYTDYSTMFGRVLSEATSVTNELFEFTNSSQNLRPSYLLRTFLTAVDGCTTGLLEPTNLNSDQLVAVSIFRLAAADRTLRLMLFQFLLLASVASNDKTQSKQVFERVASDLKTISGLTYAANNAVNPPSLDGGLAELQPSLRQLITVIQNHVSVLVNGQNTADATTTGDGSSTSLSVGGLSDSSIFAPVVVGDLAPTNLNKPNITIQRGAFQSAFLSCVSPSSSATNTLFKAFIDISHALDQSASQQGSELSYVLSDTTGRTKFNFISTTHILLCIFELFVAIINKYVNGNFIQSTNPATFKLEVEIARSVSNHRLLQAVSTQTNLNSVVSDLMPSLLNVVTKVDEEDKTIQNILHILSVVNNRLGSGAFYTSQFINNSTRLRQGLTTAITTNLEPTQLRVSNWLLEKYLTEQRQSSSTLGVTKLITVDERNSLFAMLREPTPNKIMAIGIPTGFVDKISNRIKRSKIDSLSFKNQTTNIVYVNVYKRSSEFDDIIFKPQRFLFDLSLFYSGLNQLGITPETTFAQIINNPKIALEDYEQGPKTPMSLETLFNSPRHDFLTRDEKASLFKNHVVSGLWNTYSVMTTGLKFSEETFTVDNIDLEVDIVSPEIESVVRRYFTEVRRRPLPSGDLKFALTSPSVAEQDKDEIKLLVYGHNSFKPSVVESKILTSKLFDRVLLLPINNSEFEVDVAQTQTTDSGRRALLKDSIQNLLKTKNGRQYLVLPETSIVFDDFFVNVETAR